jgi:sulfur carrier protein ThiS adenylyltransferase
MLFDKEQFLKGLTEKNETSVTGKLRKAIVGISGCGGLGSNVAAALVRVGVKKLIIVDFDEVVLSNLNRQFFFVDDIGKRKVDALYDNLKRINPFVEIEKKHLKINKDNLFELFKEADVIVEAFDEAAEKAMIIDTFLGNNEFRRKYLVCASGIAGFESSNTIQTKKFGERVFIAGDFCSQSCEKGVMANRVLIGAAHEANMVVRIIAGLRTV